VGDFTFISSTVNITGNKRIGRSAYLGVKSTVNCDINDNVLVSAGSCVMKEVAANSIVFNGRKEEVIAFGTPAELQKMTEQLGS
jgi:UDP-3-O-[3-hydroxymyristoyl] glucosamine N-acyltransferase